MTDEYYMIQALELAERARGYTSPNPLVGAVVVREHQIVGRGYHQKAGTAHAEIHALNEAGALAQDATVYVTLEPCNHYGRTGPCTEALIKAGVRKVVAAMTDPNPKVAGQGFSRLRAAGIEVIEGVCASQAARQNDSFIKWITTGRPLIALKTAMTLDGKIATYTGHSRWITSPESRQFVHCLRHQFDAILVGIGTILADDPQLTVRLPEIGVNPARVILDSKARTPISSQVVTDSQAPTLIVVTAQAPIERVEALRQTGAEVLCIPSSSEGVDLTALFTILGQRSITSVLIEGGAGVNGAILEAGLADKLYWFIAPKLVGGREAPSPVAGNGVATMDQAWELEDTRWEFIGSDILLTGDFVKREGRHVYRSCGRIG